MTIPEAWVAVIFTIICNIVAWVYTYGKLNQKVATLSRTLENGLCAKVNELSVDVARLKGIMEGLAKLINEKNSS